MKEVEVNRGSKLSRKQNILFIIIVLLFSYHYTRLRFTMNYEYKQATLNKLIDYSAETPFQHRILVPWLAKNLINIKIPPQPINWLVSLFFDFHETVTSLPPQKRIFFKLIEMFSAFCLVFAFRHYILLFINNEKICTLFSLSLFYILPFNFLLSRKLTTNYYSWDTPSVLFFTLGLIFIYKRDWVKYYLLFVVATFNRETTCFLTVIYLFTAIKKIKPQTIIFHVIFQFIIWAAVKYFLYNLFVGNPGMIALEKYLINYTYIMRYRNIVMLAGSIGFLWIPTLYYYRSIRDDFLKRSFLVVFPFVLSMFCVGQVFELRIFGELIPVVLAAFFHILYNFLKKEMFISNKIFCDKPTCK